MSAVRQLIQGCVNLLDTPPTRGRLAALLPLYGKRLPDGVRRLEYKDGWVHYFVRHTIVEPSPRLRGYHLEEPMNADLWGYLYTPKPGDIVFDVGAHLGFETIYFADKMGPEGKVVSIEALPRICAMMKRSVELNGMAQVIPVGSAVSDAPGEVLIEDSDASDALANAINSGSGVPVKAETIDTICETLGIGHIDFLKMNIEGAERPALLGMERMIRNTKVVAISCHDFREGNPFFITKQFVIEFLQSRGWVIVHRKDSRAEIAAQVNAFNPAMISPAELSPAAAG